MTAISIIGTIAPIFSTGSFLPQVIKVFKTKKTKDLSFPAYFFLGSGCVLWTTYGFLIRDFPIVITNSVIAILILIILLAKLHYDKK